MSPKRKTSEIESPAPESAKSSSPFVDWNKLTVEELNAKCVSRGLVQSGDKAVLIGRLSGLVQVEIIDPVPFSDLKSTGKASSARASKEKSVGGGEARKWKKLTVVELKAELNARGLSVSGTKPMLITRLSFAPDHKRLVKHTSKSTPVPKQGATPRSRQLPIINVKPSKILDVFVFGENDWGQLGVGHKQKKGARSISKVKRPRLNDGFLSAEKVGVVAIAIGGTHCIALTRDNKILTWGSYDSGALGRKVAFTGTDEDNVPEGYVATDLNPAEAEPREVDAAYFPEDTQFTSVYAGNSSSFVLTTTGLVYGWGAFRGNEGVIGFTPEVKESFTPVLISGLKEVTELAAGANHVLALDTKGRCFIWGAGQQCQLGRKYISRTAAKSLVPREFGLQRKPISHIGAGDDFSFAVARNGDVYTWGLNSFGQCGTSSGDQAFRDVQFPTIIDSLKGVEITQITGGTYHAIALTKTGEVLTWGRSQSLQSGFDVSNLPNGNVYKSDWNGRIIAITKPSAIPNITGAMVVAGLDTGMILTPEGKAFSWGYSASYQTGLGTDYDVSIATDMTNDAIQGKKMVFGGMGRDFGLLAGLHEED